MTDRSQDDHLDEGLPEKDFEQNLRRALRRQKPSEEFAARLLTRMAQRTQPKPTAGSWWPLPRLRWAVASVICVAMTVGGAKYEQHRHAEGEAARQQVMVALRIAGAKIQLAQSRVQQLSQH